jgi:hypothetical protein
MSARHVKIVRALEQYLFYHYILGYFNGSLIELIDGNNALEQELEFLGIVAKTIVAPRQRGNSQLYIS